MTGADDGRKCSECGAELDGSVRCESCGARARGIELKVLPRSGGRPAADGPPAVRLVRQLKMPTVEHLVAGPDVERLPEAMEGVEDALEEGDLAAADERLDAALGAVLEGPGHRRAGPDWSFLPVVLWVWCGILLLLFLLSWWV